jgi:hypothetical protein
MDGVQELLTGLEITEGMEMIPHFEGGMLYLNDIPVLQLGLGFALVSPTERTLVGSCEDGWTDIEGEPSEGEILEGQTEGQSEGQTEGETVEGEAIEGQPVEGTAPEGQSAEGDAGDGETPADGAPAEGDAGEGQSQPQEGDIPAPSKGCFGA